MRAPDSLFLNGGPTGDPLQRLLFRRIKDQIETVLADDVLTEALRLAVWSAAGRRETEWVVEGLLGDQFGNRLLYGTVRKLAEKFRGEG